MCTSIGISDCSVKERVTGIQSPRNILVLIGMATPIFIFKISQHVSVYCAKPVNNVITSNNH